MPIAVRAAAVYNFTLTPRDAIPLVRGWNRLEGRPRSADFERSLRAEVRDPLWFLTRQWQFGEFEGDDAGSPIDARIAYETAPLDGYRSGADILPYDGKTPLEARVEGEAVPFDLMLHMQAARVFERLLADRGRGARLHDYVGLFVLDYDAGVAGEGTSEARAMFDAGQSFLFDAAQLIAAVRDGSRDAHRWFHRPHRDGIRAARRGRAVARVMVRTGLHAADATARLAAGPARLSLRLRFRRRGGHPDRRRSPRRRSRLARLRCR
jgi:hypothetical protein